MWNTPPKFGVGVWGVGCGGQSAVKVTEMEMDEEKREEKKIGHVGTRGVRSLRPSHSSLRPALWTIISTSRKAIDA